MDSFDSRSSAGERLDSPAAVELLGDGGFGDFVVDGVVVDFSDDFGLGLGGSRFDDGLDGLDGLLGGFATGLLFRSLGGCGRRLGGGCGSFGLLGGAFRGRHGRCGDEIEDFALGQLGFTHQLHGEDVDAPGRRAAGLVLVEEVRAGVAGQAVKGALAPLAGQDLEDPLSGDDRIVVILGQQELEDLRFVLGEAQSVHQRRVFRLHALAECLVGAASGDAKTRRELAASVNTPGLRCLHDGRGGLFRGSHFVKVSFQLDFTLVEWSV